MRNQSKNLHARAIKQIPGGVNSPVRAFGSVNSHPIYAKSGKGSKLLDVDGNQYIDYICSWGPLILGHSSPIALKGIDQVIKEGTTFGLPTQVELDLAEVILEALPMMDQVRMVNSGTEATMSALRLARGYTGRDKIIKFEGCYHGHSDGLLIQSGSGTLTSGVPTSLGVTQGVLQDTFVAEFNQLESVEKYFQAYPEDIAAIIVEPIPGNMGLIEANPGFLQGLRQLCDRYESVLIFDEVISGFRIAYGGATVYYNVEPDLICLGKIIGGGMPVGAYAGKKPLMDCIAPMGGVYQAGTLSGNPVAMTMGLNVLTYLKEHPEIYKQLEETARALEEGFKENLRSLNLRDVTINRVGGMLCQFFTEGPVKSYEQVMQSDTKAYAKYFSEMLQQDILLPPAQFECMFLSTAHTKEDITKTIQAHKHAMRIVKEI